jgi:hypothetical protein
MTIDTKTAAAFIVLITLVMQIGLGYFNIPGKLTCTLAQLEPGTQAAAAALLGR